MDQLSRERAQLHAHLAENQRAISTVRLIPPELWARIFLFCLPDNDPENEDDPYPIDVGRSKWCQDRVPFILELVCRDWLDIVRFTPVLWTDISVIVTSKNWELQLDECLKRSGTLPLSLELAYEAGPFAQPRVDSDFYRYINDRLLHTSPRWRTLRLFLPGVFLAEFLSGSHPTPQLTSLTVRGPINSWLPSPISTSQKWITVPNLQSLKLGFLQNAEQFVHTGWWSRLTSLSVRHSSNYTILETLRSTPLLQRLSVFAAEDIPSTPSSILMMYLKDLRIMNLIDSDSIAVFLHHITVPSLAHLHFSCPADKAMIGPAAIAAIIAMHERSQCSLMSVRFDGIDLGLNPNYLDGKEAIRRQCKALLKFVEQLETIVEVKAVCQRRMLELEDLKKVASGGTELTLAQMEALGRPFTGRSSFS